LGVERSSAVEIVTSREFMIAVFAHSVMKVLLGPVGIGLSVLWGGLGNVPFRRVLMPARGLV